MARARVHAARFLLCPAAKDWRATRSSSSFSMVRITQQPCRNPAPQAFLDATTIKAICRADSPVKSGPLDDRASLPQETPRKNQSF